MSSQHRDQIPQCTVCLEKTADSSINGCQHTFCLRCIRKWAKSKNTCPLCRKEFLQIRSQKRKYTVIPPPPPPPRRRITSSIQQQRRIVYIPIILNQPVCYFYDPNTSMVMNGPIDLTSLGHHFAIPSFFIPN